MTKRRNFTSCAGKCRCDAAQSGSRQAQDRPPSATGAVRLPGAAHPLARCVFVQRQATLQVRFTPRFGNKLPLTFSNRRRIVVECRRSYLGDLL